MQKPLRVRATFEFEIDAVDLTPEQIAERVGKVIRLAAENAKRQIEQWNKPKTTKRK
jgi:hypothetical protein